MNGAANLLPLLSYNKEKIKQVPTHNHRKLEITMPWIFVILIKKNLHCGIRRDIPSL